MNLDNLKQYIMHGVDTYEESVRRYLDKVDIDRPWVGERMWQETWHFRLELLELIENYRKKLEEAKRLKDPG